MNKVLEETLATEKADPTFEQRMLSAFRSKVPRRSSIGAFLVNVMRLRAAQITAAAAMLLALVQVGRTVTGERGAGSRNRAYFATNKVGAEPAQAPPTFFDTLDASHKSDDRRNKENDRLAAGESLARGQTSAAPAAAPAKAKDETQKSAEVERTIVTGSNIPTAAEVGPTPSSVPTGAANRKLIRNAQVELEIVSFDDAVQKITSFASEERGYVATSTSEKQANGKLKGEVVIKIIPENLDGFLKKIRGLGELKNQTLGTEDVTKAYFDTDSRLKNALVMGPRLIDMLKTNTVKVSDLLQVEKELGRVRDETEKMQRELKYMDAFVQFVTVTVSIA